MKEVFKAEDPDWSQTTEFKASLFEGCTNPNDSTFPKSSYQCHQVQEQWSEAANTYWSRT